MCNQKKSRFALKACMAALALLLAATGILIVRHNLLLSSICDLRENPPCLEESVMLEGVQVLSQRHSYSCGLTSITMARSYLDSSVTEQELTDELGLGNRKKGMLPSEFLQYARLGLSGRTVQMVSNRPDTEVLALIYSQLKKGIPVPVYFSTENQWDRPNDDTHFSLIIGMAPDAGTITVANAYGFLDTVTITEMLDAMKFRNYRRKPLYFLVAEYSGVIGMNNIFLIGE